MGDEPRSKGAGFTSTAQVLREGTRDDEWDRFLAALPEDTAALVRRPPLAVAWLDVQHFARLITVAQRELYAGDAAALTAIGRKAIGNDLNTLYRMFIRLSSPGFVIARAAKLWSQYNQNHGSVVAAADGAHAAKVAYRALAIGSDAFWAYSQGAIMAAVDATGVKNGQIALIDGGGVASADFRVTWE